jgi:uncharacterized membrane protein
MIGPFVQWLRSRGYILLVAVLCAAILHIAATLAAPSLAGSTPFTKLAAVAPLHSFKVLPPVTPQTQPLAFASADVRYAICRYDTSRGPVSVSARLPSKGWTLSLHTPEGDNFYTALGQDTQPVDVVLMLTPTADRFLGLTPEARGKASETAATLSLASGSGLIVVRGPDRGIAYRGEADEILKKATCRSLPF